MKNLFLIQSHHLILVFYFPVSVSDKKPETAKEKIFQIHIKQWFQKNWHTLSHDAVATNDDPFTFTNLPYSLGLLVFLLGLLLLTEHASLLDFTTFTPSFSGKDNFTINKNNSRFWIIHWLKRRNFKEHKSSAEEVLSVNGHTRILPRLKT